MTSVGCRVRRQSHAKPRVSLERRDRGRSISEAGSSASRLTKLAEFVSSLEFVRVDLLQRSSTSTSKVNVTAADMSALPTGSLEAGSGLAALGSVGLLTLQHNGCVTMGPLRLTCIFMFLRRPPEFRRPR